MKKEPTVRLFAYGTLKSGCKLNRCLRTSTKICNAILYDHALISLGPFPALIALPDSTRYGMYMAVEGEVYDVPEKVFVKIREMEESVGYETRSVTLMDEENKEVEAKAFIFKDIREGTYEWTCKKGVESLEFLPC